MRSIRRNATYSETCCTVSVILLLRFRLGIAVSYSLNTGVFIVYL